MGEETIAELTRRAFALWNERDFDRLLELFHPDAVWDTRPMEVPGMDEFRGHDGLRRFFREWLDSFPDSTVEVERVETRGDWGVATVVQHVSGGASGAPVPFRYFGIGRWDEGRLRLVENHTDEHRARLAFDRYCSEQQPSARPL